MSAAARARMTMSDIRYIFVEGNIGAGKSTVLDKVTPVLAKLLAKDGADLITVPEPIDRWTSVGGHNLFAAFYADQARWSALFQAHAMVTRVEAVDTAVEAWRRQRQQEENGVNVPPRTLYVLCERSIHTDRHIFVRALHEAGSLSDMELATYKEWWDFWQQRLYPGRVVAVVHLRAEPQRCERHIRERDRTAESAVTQKYLAKLGDLHDEAMAQADTWSGAPRLVLSVDELGDMPGDEAAATACAQRMHNFVKHR